MTNILLYSITAILAAAAFWVLRGRENRVLMYLRHFAAALAVASVVIAFEGKEAYSIGKLLLAAAVGLGLFFYAPINIFNKFRGGLGKIGISFGETSGSAGGEYIRGAKLVNGQQLQKILKKESGSLTVGGQKIPERLEARHFMLAGSTGVGKSVAISEMLDGIAARGDRVFIADAGGNFLKNYYDEERGDIILNPLDSRAVSWSPLAEMEGPWDADLIAKSIVPDGDGGSKEWNQYAQVITSAVLKHCWQNDLTNFDIFRLAIIANIEELRMVFEGTPAQPLVAEGNEKMFGSIRGIVGTYISPFQYLDPAAGANNGFSLKSIVEDNGAKNWLFFNYPDKQISTVAPIIAAMTDIVSKSILSLEADNNRKFWLIIDEFASVGRISSILDFLTKARKNGGRAIIGVQTISQLKSAYGVNDASTLMSCLSSQIVFRVPDPDTADIMSRLLGDQQISRVIQSGGESSQSMQIGGSKSENWSQQITTDRIVMTGEIMNFPDLYGILNFAGDIPAAPIEVEWMERHKVAEHFQATTRKEIKIAAPAKPAEIQKPTETENTAVSDSDLPGVESDDVI
ncbi:MULTISPECIES: type IV secretion system DNA-binding domain-containing protein [Diaphorobacter]|uniref:Type IV secretory pathway VirD4 component n=1 Tax=Acidovorax ebreus (strain TPSY) TaxID=535289 RepID=A0A9J9UB12_ACIET|nr:MULTISPECIES: type IV secretion system DNA-binding domain-containing protein [Diaphorobacter]ACM33027.1 putative type IV secretory pathway VirD4 component [[Acidovorax] ebreus TPSY]